MRTCTLAGFLTLCAALPLQAQTWNIDAYAGRATFSDVPTATGSSNAVLGLRRSGETWLYMQAAAPLSDTGPLWGAAGLGSRTGTTTGLLTLGVDMAGHGHAYRTSDTAQTGAGGTLSVMPLIALGTHAARLELRSGLRQYGATYAGTSYSRRLHETDARLAVRPASTLDLEAEVRHARAEEDAYTFAGGSATFQAGPVDFWASAGRWLHDALPDMAWSAGARLDVGHRFDLWVGVQNDATDPLYWNESRQGWNIGVSRSFGGARPVRLLATAPTPGGITFSVPVAEARAAPSVAGDFNAWTPASMRRSGDAWIVTLPIAPGTYHYAFRHADGTWFLPSSVHGRVDDGFGGVSALLIVE
jgi:hypothetical protein